MLENYKTYGVSCFVDVFSPFPMPFNDALIKMSRAWAVKGVKNGLAAFFSRDASCYEQKLAGLLQLPAMPVRWIRPQPPVPRIVPLLYGINFIFYALVEASRVLFRRSRAFDANMGRVGNGVSPHQENGQRHPTLLLSGAL
ncbi:hypothetical protein L249_1749 [Ophiocordyceps polyrhachis-furcata BCC 54312]|uniref:Uncharacterized protein n=1 Tax=Ophiocordyceps polyrhachis-furcata BCC 54312 TaxID=1330021 RepID=A0A367LNI5_9HYPO|nr:hypothetical protein L249_1749 [Ophiocordyceps polyrhachis-furcata BCC 54312]